MDLIKIVKTIEPEYKNTDQCINPLPNEVELTLDNEDYLIEVNLKEDVLKTNFWQGAEIYKASSDDSNLRDNDSELRIFAKEMIKTNIKLNQSKTL